MSGEGRYPVSGEGGSTPPSVGDVLHAGAAYGWPEVVLDGELVLDAGEPNWRAAMTPALATRVWAVWHDDAEVDEADDPEADA